MASGCVIVFTKQPKSGGVKTRLVPPLRPQEAADLQAAFLVDLTRNLEGIDARRVLAIPSDDDAAACARLAPPGWETAEQGEGDLGARLARSTRRAFAEGSAPVAVVGSDHPHLPLAAVEGALRAAARGGVGWITTDDGGYACLALPRPLPELFTDIPWSSPGVAAATRTAARRIRVVLQDFGPWYDLDTADDVDRFLADPANARACPATWTSLAALKPSWAERRRSHE